MQRYLIPQADTTSTDRLDFRHEIHCQAGTSGERCRPSRGGSPSVDASCTCTWCSTGTSRYSWQVVVLEPVLLWETSGHCSALASSASRSEGPPILGTCGMPSLALDEPDVGTLAFACLAVAKNSLLQGSQSAPPPVYSCIHPSQKTLTRITSTTIFL